MSSNKRVLIIDALNMYFRAYIVDPSLSTNGQPIGGVKGFLKILQKQIRESKPDEVVICWDGEGGSQKRRSTNKNYKAGRKPPKINAKSKPRLNRWVNTMSESQQAENRIWQQIRSMEYLNQTPVVQFRVPNIEADDVISYVKSLPAFSEWQKVIVSSDKDFIQLLDKKTLLYRPVQKEVLNENRIVENFGIHPKNFATARAMAGDQSDGIKGLERVGLKTVAKAFPFLSENKSYLLDDLKNYSSQQEESNLKIYQKVIDNFNVVCDNYSIMQLDTPLLSVQSANFILETFKEYTPALNKTEFRKMLSVDGITEVNFDCLWTRFNSLVEVGTVFN